MAVKSAEVTIEGTSALLMHRFPLEPIEALEKKPIEEQAEIAAYRTDDGELYVPGVNVQRALVSAATFSKGKGRATLQKPAAACMLVTPEHLLLGETEYKIDTRPVVIPSTRGRILRHRPRLDDWKITFEVEWDDVLVSTIQARTIVDDMCRRVGLLDYRPECKGPYGRSMVTHWEMSD